jgi:hypothetical protein
MQEGCYLGVHIRYSASRNYRIDTHKTIESEGKKLHAATIMKKIRSYWEPVLSGVSLTDKELEEYLAQ